MKNLRITLLGAFEIGLNGKPAQGFDSDKTRALLAYLVIEADQPHRRDYLAEMLWPGKPEGEARKNLKQALANMRKAIGDRASSSPFLLASRKEIRFNGDSYSWIDVKEFGKLLDDVNSHTHQSLTSCDTCTAWLKQAVELYRGDYLEQFYLSDSAAFEEWVTAKREGFQRQMSDTLRKLTLIFEAKKDYGNARKYARCLMNLEAWNEQNHRHLMRLLALSRRRSAALKQFHTCRQILADELGVEPSAETVALFEQIKVGQLEDLTEVAVVLENGHSRGTADNQLKALTFRWLAIIPTLVILLVGLYVVIPQNALIRSNGDGSIPPGELEILITLYEKTNGPNWKNANGWMSESSPCEWYGVTCVDESIAQLRMEENNLSGIIPHELSGLKNLYVLNLSQNQITGSIPPELGNLPKLRVLDLSFNLLSGTIPPELGNLAELRELYVDGNPQLSGPIPPELGDLFNLTHLELSSYLGPTQLSGPIPPELGQLEQLMVLLIDNCQVSGPIPPEMGDLIALLWLGLSHNQLSGALPSEFGELVNLDTFDIGGEDSDLYGPLPMSMIKMTMLHSFDFRLANFCEPPDPAFQLWLESIPALWRTDIRCVLGEE